MQDSNKLNVDEWPEIRKVKVSNKIGWMYFAEMCKSVMSELGEEKGAELIKAWAEKIALEKIVPAMREMGLDGSDFIGPASGFRDMKKK